MNLLLHAVADTDPGEIYHINEDSVFAYTRPPGQGEPLGLLIVADGIGGHKAGEVASKLTVDTIQDQLKDLFWEETNTQKKFLRKFTLKSIEDKLRLAVESANRVIYNFSKQNPDSAGGLGSTVASGIIFGDTAIIANVGDSRIYLFRNGKLKQISEDHSYVSALIRKGIEPQEAYYHHPYRNVITRSLGNEDFVEVDTWTIGLEPGDRLLLCSDGLWEVIAGDEIIEKYLDINIKIEDSVAFLIKAANQNGGKDNIGVVIAEILAAE